MPSALELLKASLRLYRAHTALLSGLLAWLLIPYAGTLAATLIQDDVMSTTVMVVFGVATVILAIWLTGLVMQIVNAISQKHTLDLPTLRRRTRSLFIPFVLVSILQSLVILGGFLLLIIPGIIFAVWYAYAHTAVILDGQRGMAALSFSRTLVRGRFWEALWLMMSGPIIVMIIYGLIFAAISLVTGAFGALDLSALVAGGPLPVWLDVLDTITQTLVVTPLLLVYEVLLYNVLKETRKPV